MYQNLLALHAVDLTNQETIFVEDIYEVVESLASLPSLSTSKRQRQAEHSTQEPNEPMAYFEWPPSEEEFFVALEEHGWRICTIVSHNEASDTIKAHQLEPIKTRAKDDFGKT